MRTTRLSQLEADLLLIIMLVRNHLFKVIIVLLIVIILMQKANQLLRIMKMLTLKEMRLLQQDSGLTQKVEQR